MNKLLITLSLLISIISITSQSWALPNCPSSQPFENCYGSYTFANGNTYVGEWKNNQFNGEGIFIFKSGEKYIGQFKNDKKYGQGTYIYKNGDRYVGKYKNDKQHGQGIYTYVNGDKYIGKYKNGKKNGLGIYSYGLNTKWAGYKYKGEFKNGKRDGQGTFNYADGSKDIGKFQNDELNGFAISFDKYGNILKEGIWKNDKFLYSQKKPTLTSNSKIEEYNNFCSGIGLTKGTEKFNECLFVYKNKITTNINLSITKGTKFEKSKIFCKEIGLINGTDKFNECLKIHNIKIHSYKHSSKIHKNNKIVFSGSGTGFVVASNGYLITNYHVINGCDVIKIHHKDKILQASIIALDSRNDIALIKGDFISKTVLPFSSKKTELLQEIYVAGYPFGNTFSNSIKVTKGIISALTGIGNNISNFQIDAAIQPGNSGGPILNKKGNVIGVVVAKLDRKYIENNFGVVPENTNFGIKINVVKKLLENKNIKLINPNKKDILTTQLSENISSSTYFISCWKQV